MKYLSNAIQITARTFRYVLQVRRVAPSPSDAFAIPFDRSVTLQEFHTAFLFSPVFQTELFLLQMLNIVAPVSNQQLSQVGTAKHDQFALWRTIVRRLDGRTTMMMKECLDKSTKRIYEARNTIVVMRCYTPSPFCDTWWSIESNDGMLSLQFGTTMLGAYSSSWIVAALDPFHQLYSRILLASAKETLERTMIRSRNDIGQTSNN